MGVVGFVIVACWIAFWAYWVVAALGAKPAQGRGSAFAGGRVAIIVVVVFLVRALGFHPRSSAHNGAVLTGIGLALFAAGLGLAIWARLYIGRNWGMPMTRKEQPELVTTGPYRRVRHPIYTGIIVAMLGTALATTLYGLIAVAVLSGYFIYSATREEAYLAGQFPDAYPAYKHSTKMLLPLLF